VDLRPFGLENFIDFVHKFLSVSKVFAYLDIISAESENGKIFSKVSSLDRFNNCGLEAITEFFKLIVAINLGAMLETTSPGED